MQARMEQAIITTIEYLTQRTLNVTTIQRTSSGTGMEMANRWTFMTSICQWKKVMGQFCADEGATLCNLHGGRWRTIVSVICLSGHGASVA